MRSDVISLFSLFLRETVTSSWHHTFLGRGVPSPYKNRPPTYKPGNGTSRRRHGNRIGKAVRILPTKHTVAFLYQCTVQSCKKLLPEVFSGVKK
jgi:hypothetical protein